MTLTDDHVELKDIETKGGLEQRLALIRFYFGEEPTTFTRIAKLWGQLEYSLQFEGKLKKNKIKVV